MLRCPTDDPADSGPRGGQRAPCRAKEHTSARPAGCFVLVRCELTAGSAPATELSVVNLDGKAAVGTAAADGIRFATPVAARVGEHAQPRYHFAQSPVAARSETLEVFWVLFAGLIVLVLVGLVLWVAIREARSPRLPEHERQPHRFRDPVATSHRGGQGGM